MNLIYWLVVLGLLSGVCISGCSSYSSRFYMKDQERVDQDLPGYSSLGSTNAPVVAPERKKTRKVFVWEVEKKAKLENVSAGVAAPAVTEDSAVDVQSFQGGEYVVTEDDTLQKISKKVYGHYSGWLKIYEANKDQIPDPDHIRPGTMLRIPGK